MSQLAVYDAEHQSTIEQFCTWIEAHSKTDILIGFHIPFDWNKQIQAKFRDQFYIYCPLSTRAYNEMILSKCNSIKLWKHNLLNSHANNVLHCMMIPLVNQNILRVAIVEEDNIQMTFNPRNLRAEIMQELRPAQQDVICLKTNFIPIQTKHFHLQYEQQNVQVYVHDGLHLSIQQPV